MRTITQELQQQITPDKAIDLLKEGNIRFTNNLKINRNLLQQVNETTDSQHPFAVIISCMDSRTSAELIFDQGLGDIFSIRIAGNIINEDILASSEFGCKIAGAKVIVVLGHTSCGAIKGAIDDVKLGHLPTLTQKIRRHFPKLQIEKKISSGDMDVLSLVTEHNIIQSVQDLRERSTVLAEMVKNKELKIVGALYDLSTGFVRFMDN